MGTLRFDGADDRLRWATLATNLLNVSDGAWTFAAGVKRATDDAAFHAFSYLLSGTGNGTVEAGLSINGSDALQTDVDAFAQTGPTITGTTETYFIVASKGAGSSPITYSRYVKSTTTWTHQTTAGNLVDQIAATMLELGAWQGTGDFFDGWMSVAAWWEGAMSQADKEALVANWRTSDLWTSAHGQPAFLVELNVAGASVSDLAGNASALTATGTTLDAAETFSSWNYNGTGAGGPAVDDFPAFLPFRFAGVG
jgi:hypothetical protein